MTVNRGKGRKDRERAVGKVLDDLERKLRELFPEATDEEITRLLQLATLVLDDHKVKGGTLWDTLTRLFHEGFLKNLEVPIMALVMTWLYVMSDKTPPGGSRNKDNSHDLDAGRVNKAKECVLKLLGGKELLNPEETLHLLAKAVFACRRMEVSQGLAYERYVGRMVADVLAASTCGPQDTVVFRKGEGKGRFSRAMEAVKTEVRKRLNSRNMNPLSDITWGAWQ